MQQQQKLEILILNISKFQALIRRARVAADAAAAVSVMNIEEWRRENEEEEENEEY